MSLTENDKLLVRTTWKKLSQLGLQNVGLHIFVTLFVDHPPVKAYFKKFVPADMEVTFENLKSRPEMATHALNVALSIDRFISSLENSPEFADYLKEIAAVHEARKIEKGAFDILGQVILKVIKSALESEGTDDVMNTWGKAYGAIKEGIVKQMYC